MQNFALGIARPIQPRNQFEQSIERSHKKRKIAETHVSNQKKHDFINDKYSLQNIVSN